jgi:Flp pilus assembly protein TadD
MARTGSFTPIAPMSAAAIVELGKATELTGCGPEVTGIGYVYARAGKHDEARSVIAELRQLST